MSTTHKKQTYNSKIAIQKHTKAKFTECGKRKMSFRLFLKDIFLFL